MEYKKEHIGRAPWMDYKDPSILLITMVTTDRQPILGKLKGMTIARTALGQAVAEEIEKIPTYKGAASIEIYEYVVMPDHVHILLRIHDRLPKHIGQYLAWFKIKCTDACCAITGGPVNEVSRLFAPEYHDRILKGKNQLANMKRYIQDNPRRLALKRANKELFTIHQEIRFGKYPCVAMGNIFLADYPLRSVVKCSRRLTQTEIDELKAECLEQAQQGVVHITGAISEGEKQIARALRENGYPLIIVLQNGFPKPNAPHYSYYKPAGVYFEACAKGKLLLVEPYVEVLEMPEIVEKTEAKVGKIPHDTQRYRFVAMNMVAEGIAEERGQEMS